MLHIDSTHVYSVIAYSVSVHCMYQIAQDSTTFSHSVYFAIPEICVTPNLLWNKLVHQTVWFCKGASLHISFLTLFQNAPYSVYFRITTGSDPAPIHSTFRMIWFDQDLSLSSSLLRSSGALQKLQQEHRCAVQDCAGVMPHISVSKSWIYSNWVQPCRGRERQLPKI